jgi:hypothetical protein
LNIGEQIYDSQFGMEMIQEMGIDVSDEWMGEMMRY